jgi:hypothetical protein
MFVPWMWMCAELPEIIRPAPLQQQQQQQQQQQCTALARTSAGIEACMCSCQDHHA